MSSVLIIADIEGSIGCRCREDASLFNSGWVRACVGLSLDLAAICNELKKAGAGRIRIKDFHRTGCNIFSELLPGGVELDQGYSAGPVIGIGEVDGFDMAMFVGMHAASGPAGFLPHTLTSRFALLTADGAPLCEAQLFASSLASSGLAAAFFSGCDQACSQAKLAMPWLQTFSINKPLTDDVTRLRGELAKKAAAATKGKNLEIYNPGGPFRVVAKMRDGEKAAKKLRQRWKIGGSGDKLEFVSPDMNDLYWKLLKIAYLGPMSYRFLRPSLALANFFGSLSLAWARRQARKNGWISQPS